MNSAKSDPKGQACNLLAFCLCVAIMLWTCQRPSSSSRKPPWIHHLHTLSLFLMHYASGLLWSRVSKVEWNYIRSSPIQPLEGFVLFCFVVLKQLRQLRLFMPLISGRSPNLKAWNLSSSSLGTRSCSSLTHCRLLSTWLVVVIAFESQLGEFPFVWLWTG